MLGGRTRFRSRRSPLRPSRRRSVRARCARANPPHRHQHRQRARVAGRSRLLHGVTIQTPAPPVGSNNVLGRFPATERSLSRTRTKRTGQPPERSARGRSALISTVLVGSTHRGALALHSRARASWGGAPDRLVGNSGSDAGARQEIQEHSIGGSGTCTLGCGGHRWHLDPVHICLIGSGRTGKGREVIQVEQTRVHLDEVVGLGPFLELEMVLEEGLGVEEGQRTALKLMGALETESLVEEAYIDLLESNSCTVPK